MHFPHALCLIIFVCAASGFSASARAQPLNNTCGASQGMFSIPGLGGSVTQTVSAWTSDGSPCGAISGSPGADVYYYFTPNASALWEISLCSTAALFDSVLSVHSACPASNANSIACNDDGFGACPVGLSRIAAPLTAGFPYVIRVANRSGNSGRTFTLTVTNPANHGACCLGGSCTTTDSTSCAGVFAGLGSSCTPTPCGACCAPSGVCSFTIAASCTGAFAGAGTCSPNPCGACCASGGACSITSSLACAGIASGAGSTCSPTPCGACCTSAGACSCSISGACSGTFFAAGSVCSPTPCPAGACCNNTSGACLVRLPTLCLAGSAYRGDGTNCSPNLCPQLGACCDNTASGLCVQRTSVQCTAPNTFLGAAMSCSPEPCPPLGACCSNTSTDCLSRTQPACALLAGRTFAGAGSTCASGSPCLGACCNQLGCSLQLAQNCPIPGGFLGLATTCAPGIVCPTNGCGASFNPTIAPQTGLIQPSQMVSGNFNNDPYPDLVVYGANANNSLAVLLGTAAGGFTLFVQPGSFYFLPPSAMIAGDFTDDGNTDLACAIPDPNNPTSALGSLAIFAGNGAGSFALHGAYTPLGVNPSGMVSADFNGDGKPDLAAACTGASDNRVFILTNSGAGSFSANIQTYTIAALRSSLAVGHLNGDTAPDLLLTSGNPNSAIEVIINNGNGTFHTTPGLGIMNPGNVCVAVADFDGDAIADLAMAFPGGPTAGVVRVLRGSGAGTFAPSGFDFPVVVDPLGISVAELNGDGRPDLVASGGMFADLSIVINNGAGAFQTPIPTYGLGSYLNSIAFIDYNHDGRLDIAVNSPQGTGPFFPSWVRMLANTTPAQIVQPPQSCQLLQPGQTLSLSVAACGYNPISYQWRKGGANLVNGGRVSGATSPTLTISSATPLDSDGYDCRITSGTALTATSAIAIVAVSGSDACAGLAPSITQQPVMQSVLTGAPASFTTAASAPPAGGTITYQWRRNGSTLANGSGVSGATTPTLTINPAAITDNAAAFDCIATNACGSTRSNPAGLGVAYRCPADFNHSGTANVSDIFLFLTAWFAGCS